jgi:hypothetical protein
VGQFNTVSPGSVQHRERQSPNRYEIAEQEGVTVAYVRQLLPLTCLAPDIFEAILDGRQPKGLRLADVLGNGLLSWDDQRRHWLRC